MNPLGTPQHGHPATWRPIPCFAVCIGEVGVSPAAPKTLDAGSGRDECVAFAPTTHPDPLGIRNGRSEVPSPDNFEYLLTGVSQAARRTLGRGALPTPPTAPYDRTKYGPDEYEYRLEHSGLTKY